MHNRRRCRRACEPLWLVTQLWLRCGAAGVAGGVKEEEWGMGVRQQKERNEPRDEERGAEATGILASVSLIHQRTCHRQDF